MPFTLSLRHVDTCLPCYVNDHCNGDDEALFGVVVDRSSRYHHVKAELLSELRNDTSEKMPDAITFEQIEALVNDEFSTAHPFKAFDSSLEAGTEDGESCYAWFRLTWEEDEPETVDMVPQPAQLAQGRAVSFSPFSAYRSAVRMGTYADGGYPFIAIMSDGEALCPACLKAERREILESLANRTRSSGWHFEAIDTHMEGAPIVCAHCSKDIESAYGDPDQPEASEGNGAEIDGASDPMWPVWPGDQDASEGEIDAPAMVPQPCQQQQACAVNVEFETKWNNGRRYFYSKAKAVEFAKTLKDESARVLHWGNGAIVWAAMVPQPVQQQQGMAPGMGAMEWASELLEALQGILPYAESRLEDMEDCCEENGGLIDEETHKARLALSAAQAAIANATR